MSTQKDQILLVISIFILLPQCFTQDCRYVRCDPPQCTNPVSIPGRCCHVCPPKGNTAPQGRCPRADISFPCGDHCRTDSDCSNNRKCCDHGCGRSCRTTVTVSSAACPYGGSIPSTDCEKLSGIPCPVGYYCKYSLTSGLSECCTSAEYSSYQPHPCADAVCSAVYCAKTHIPQGQCCPVCTPEQVYTTVPTSGPFYAQQNLQQSNFYTQPNQQQSNFYPQPNQQQPNFYSQPNQQQPNFLQQPNQQLFNPYQQPNQLTNSYHQPNQLSNNYCAQVNCPPANCYNPVVPQGACCPTCVNALTATPAPIPPTQAPALLDNFACMFSFCQTVQCPNSYIPPGECCHVCPVDPCANVRCPLLSCTNAYKPDGQCCSVCPPELNCFFNGKTYTSGQGFPNGCNNCTCSNGHIYCSNHTCEEPCHQNGLVYSSGSKVYSSPCQTCTCGNGVIYCTEDACKVPCYQNGLVYSSGSNVYSSPCQTCICGNGVIYCTEDICKVTAAPTPLPTQSPTQPPAPRDPCSRIVCGKVPCPVTYQPVGECCPKCLNPGDCLYEGQMFKNGAVKRENCQKCTCMDGLMVCSNDCIKQVTVKPKTMRPKTFPTPPPKRGRPPPPPTVKPFKRGPPPRPPPLLPLNMDTGPIYNQAQSGPPLSVQTSQELSAPKDPSTPVQTYPTPPTFTDSQVYQPPPRARQKGSQQAPMYPNVQSTQNKPIPAEMHQTYPKKETPKKPLPLETYLFEQALKNPQSKDGNYQKVQTPFKTQNVRQTGQSARYPTQPHSGAFPPPPGQVYQPPKRPPGSQSQYPPPAPSQTYPPPPGREYQPMQKPTGSKSKYPKQPSQQPSYPTPPGQTLSASQHARESQHGRIIFKQTGPKSRDDRCRMVHCEALKCPKYKIPRGECCPVCQPIAKLQKKAGTCPPVRRVGLCVDLCKTDHECVGKEICCYNGCGSQCFEPVLEKTINKQKR